ncbi:MAG: hypothetical protein KF901_10060 [Myxococcales bacterium]|nr:hypothetical protein [Myxococcales bacterium]
MSQAITLKQEALASVRRLRERGVTFIHETQAAGRGLLGETRRASEEFARTTRSAGEELVRTTRSAGEELVRALQEETTQLIETARKLATMPRLPAPVEVGERAVHEARDQSAKLQSELLVRLKKALQTAEAKVDSRLEQVEAPKRASKPKGAKATKATKATKAPLADYDALTAKEVVAKLAELDGRGVDALIAYERANKKRKTILDAAEKLAA